MTTRESLQSIKKEAVKKKDLNKKEKKYYDYLLDEYDAREIKRFLDAPDNFKKENHRAFSAFVYNFARNPMFSHALTKLVVKEKYFLDANKCLYLIKIFDQFTPTNDFDPEIFNKIVWFKRDLSELVLDSIPYALVEYGLKKAEFDLVERGLRYTNSPYALPYELSMFASKRSPEEIEKLFCVNLKKLAPFFCMVPKEKIKNLSENFLIELVAENASCVRYIPQEKLNQNIIVSVLKKSGGALKYIPVSLLSEELCKIAVATTPGSLRLVPKELQSNRMIASVVIKNPRCKKYIKVKK